MRELKEDTLSRNKNKDANDHVDRVLNIIDSLQELSTLGTSLKSLYPKGPILGMTPTQALTAIQTMADHSQKWHDGSSSRNVCSSINTDGLAAI
ncbi:hypothetical protein Tco_1058850, partial [Tanacetum coccineum]